MADLLISTPIPTLAQRLAGLELADLPVWVFDVDCLRFRWGNAHALTLWRAPDQAEFLARDCSDTSEAARTRLRGYLDLVRDGRRSQDEWTLYPLGTPKTMTLHIAGVELDDGRPGLLFQAFDQEKKLDTALVRGIEALRHTSVMVTLVTAGAEEVLIHNPAAQRAFGTATPLAAWFRDAEVATAIVRDAAEGKVFQREVEARTSAGDRWHEVEARRVTDPATGKLAILVHQTDATARRGAERDAEAKSRLVEELHQTLSVVERQRAEILSLSAPILDVGESTLALPIIGSLDASRSGEIGERLLAAIVQRRARTVLLDLTGAATLDVESAGLIVKLLQAVRLLGARSVVTGISPALARTLAVSEVDMAGVVVLQSLREGLAAAAGAPDRV